MNLNWNYKTSADWNTRSSMTFTGVYFNTLCVFYNDILVTENGNAGGLTGILAQTAEQNTPFMAIHRLKNDKNAVIYTKLAAKGKNRDCNILVHSPFRSPRGRERELKGKHDFRLAYKCL